MTPFMTRVASVIGTAPEEVHAPATRPSVPKPVGVGADDQIAIRSLAEQLVSEANAVLDDDRIMLTDQPLADRLGFVLRYGKRCARVETRFSNGTALGRLLGDPNVSSGPRELTGPEELERLILLLLADPEKPACAPR